jgi:NAD(P)H-flavin reductase/hemoglobin-like flavoprotein
VDVDRLKWSWGLAERLGDEAALHFYSTLFLENPETRDMFPIGMAGQRDKLLSALGHIVSHVDATEELVPFLKQLGRDHRKFGVMAEHFPAVGQALIATLAHFLDEQWTDELAEDWAEAFGVVAGVMIEAAADAAQTTPPWWEAEVIAHERRCLDVAVLQVKPYYRLPFLPGQSVAVQCHLRPRQWRYLSPANAPRPDGTIDLHIRHVPGGQVSAAIVQTLRVGDVLRLGSAVGKRLTLTPGGRPDLLLIAGGTGLAPLKALVEQVAIEGGRRRVHLYIGARTERDLYDLKALAQLSYEWPWLSVVPTVSEDPYASDFAQGSAVDVALHHGTWTEHEIFVCGSEDMVTGTVNTLIQRGIRPDQIRYESFQRPVS